MRQAIEMSCLPQASAKPQGWLARLLGGLASTKPSGLIRLDSMSAHDLRDIGLGDDPRGNHLLRDQWLRR